MSEGLARGAVVLVRFDPTVGCEIRESRPAVVVSNDMACRHDAVLQVAPIAAFPDRALRPYEARIASPASGLNGPSRAVADQIPTAAKERVAAVLGAATAEELRDLDRALWVQLGLS